MEKGEDRGIGERKEEDVKTEKVAKKKGRESQMLLTNW